MNSDAFRLDIEGFDELKRKIMLLANDKSKKNEVIAILRQVAQPTLNAVKTFVPVSERSHVARGKKLLPGNLKKSLGLILGKKGAAVENPTIYVGPRAKGQYDGWYGHFVHDGVNTYKKGFKRKRKKGANMGSAIRRSIGNPFMTKAYAQTGGGVTADGVAKIAKFIQKRIDKLSV